MGGITPPGVSRRAWALHQTPTLNTHGAMQSLMQSCTVTLVMDRYREPVSH